MGGDSFNGIVRRIVSLPRSIMGGFSRAMGGRRNHQFQPPSFPNPQPLQLPSLVPEEYGFLSSFEQQYGNSHPFFYACTFMEALKMAQDEHKFVFLYLHSPHHPFTPCFCAGTLCSDLATQFLDANFVSWGALADRWEGLQMAATLRPTTFPFCAVIAPAATGDSIAVLQQMEGPVGPGELVEILQRTMEEQGLAFRAAKPMPRKERAGARVRDEERARVTTAEEEEKLRADRRLREEQDAAFSLALWRDQEKGRLRTARAQTPVEANDEKLGHTHTQKHVGKAKQQQASVSREKERQTTQLLIRFPNGERREHSFSSADKILSVYQFIDSLRMPGHADYRLVSSFPRRIYGADQMGMTLKEAGLHPRASLFLELL